MGPERKDAEEFRNELLASRSRGYSELIYEGPYPFSLDKESCEVWAIVRLGCLELNTLLKDTNGWREEEGFCIPLGADLRKLVQFADQRKRDRDDPNKC